MINLFIICSLSIIFAMRLFMLMSEKYKYRKKIYIIKTLNDEENIEVRLRLGLLKYNEIIICDCGSTDRTKEIITEMSEKYGQIVLHSV